MLSVTVVVVTNDTALLTNAPSVLVPSGILLPINAADPIRLNALFQDRLPLPSVYNTFRFAPPVIFTFAFEPRFILPVSLEILALATIILPKCVVPRTSSGYCGDAVFTPNLKLVKSWYVKVCPLVVNCKSTPCLSKFGDRE